MFDRVEASPQCGADTFSEIGVLPPCRGDRDTLTVAYIHAYDRFAGSVHFDVCGFAFLFDTFNISEDEQKPCELAARLEQMG